MCSLAPRAAAPGFGATSFLDRQRGVVATMAPASSREPIRRARAAAEAVSTPTAPAQKRGRHDDVVDPALSPALRMRMDKELVAIQGLLKRAKLLPRSSAAPAEKKYSPPPAAPASKQQRPPAAKNLITKEVPNKQRPAVAPAPPAAAKQHQQHPVQRAAAAKTTEVPKKRRPEEEKELARAAAREQFRQMLLEMEKSALPDETIYPEDLAELGIPFEFVVTRTRKQWLEDHAKWSLHRAAAKKPIAPEVPDNKQQQRPVQCAAENPIAKAEAPKKRRPEEEEKEKELARAKAREEFRRMLLEMEKAVPPDEMVYPEELEELGIIAPRHGVAV